MVDLSSSHDGLPYDGKEYVEDMRIAPSIELSARQQDFLNVWFVAPRGNSIWPSGRGSSWPAPEEGSIETWRRTWAWM